ncbi:hypothetical protein JSQ81_13345 [Sporosarcina sp. Marseille-Q4063]|uniref:hypothetical protein n=1 Tax=Sporosarcina sp. Marseille-Q4063 TaxID=2810514 RepID=UPI001BAE8808|nr:hypothetical protein [Sporosarcina sp. Marseille-Q4063]QUW20799.1 hypothetical protein JSQ81_13345 [Sporosarcina sp. Marseille-Q4063]
MIVREKALVIQNAICVEEIIPHEDWFKPAFSLRSNVGNQEVYSTSPVIFTVEEMDNEPAFGKYTYYLGLNTMVEVDEVDDFKQLETLSIPAALSIRCGETGELSKAYELLWDYAEKNSIEIDSTFYHVCFHLYKEIIIDVYAPVIER